MRKDKKKITCPYATVINLKYMLFYFQRNEGFWCSIIALFTLAQEVSDQFCIKIPLLCLLLQSAIKCAKGNTAVLRRYHGSNKTCKRGVFLEKATTAFPLAHPQTSHSPYDAPLFPFLVLVKNTNQKYMTDCTLKVMEITGGVDETDGKMTYLEEQHFMFCFGLSLHMNVILTGCHLN